MPLLKADYFISTTIGIFGLCVLTAVWKTYRAVSSPLRNLPGPLVARFSRLWYFRQVYHGMYHKTDVELHRKHGPIVRIAPNEYSIDAPDFVQLLYGTKGGFIKSNWYKSSEVPGSPHANIFTDQINERHAANRRKISSAYSMTHLVGLEAFVDNCTTILQQRLDEFADADALMDIGHWTQCYAFDVIGQITIGKRFGFLDTGADIKGIMASLHATLKYAARVGIYYEWHIILFWVSALFNMKGMAYVMNFIQQTIDARLSAKSSLAATDANAPVDFITRFQRIQQEDSAKITNDDIFVSCAANIGAGSDTTAVSLAAAIYYLYTHPEALSQARKEIADAQSRGELSENITYKEAQKMAYLQAVIKESLRIQPATGLPFGRIVPKGGATILRQYFPAGTVVGINAWVAHRNREVFGQDADVFRPGRWLEPPEIVRLRDAYFMTFGAGSRTCLGKHISLLEMNKVIPVLIRGYDFSPEHPNGGLRTENEWFIRPLGFKCHIRKRNWKADVSA